MFFFRILLFWLHASSAFTIELNIGLILPTDTTYSYCISRVKPAILLAINQSTTLATNNIKINVIERDSQNSEIHAPLAAIEIYKEVNLFLGPIYTYGVAPIARYSPYWGVPVITPGAQETDFHDKSEYKLLTRMGPIYVEPMELLEILNKKYEWNKFGLMYHKNNATGNCYFKMWAAYIMLEKYFPHSDYPYRWKFDENSPDFSPESMLMEAKDKVRCK